VLTASVGIRSLVIGEDSCKVSGAKKGKVIVDYEVSKNLNSAVLAVACNFAAVSSSPIKKQSLKSS
jgi:hypothetical protein